jgi:hypothetical protein
MARPTIRTPELVDEICLRVAQGRSVNSISQDEDMPDAKSIWTWLNRDEVFLQKYTRAIQQRALNHADRIAEVSAAVLAGKIPPDAARVALDAMKWTASRLLPKVYGDRTQIDATVTHTHTLHLEALKELAGKGAGNGSGYIEGQAVDVASLPAFGGERQGGGGVAPARVVAGGQAVEPPDPPGTPDRPGAPACAPPALSTRPLRRGLRLREPPSPPVVGDGVVARKKRKGKGE